jgi:arylsulfatase A-like enzyme
VGQSNISAFTHGLMGYETPNIDRIANEGMTFTDYYGEQSCTAGRSSFITGQSVFRTGLSKVGLPGAKEGMQIEDPTIASMLKSLGYATGQFGKNHLGKLDELGIAAYTKQFPPRQSAASFSLDQVMGKLTPPRGVSDTDTLVSAPVPTLPRGNLRGRALQRIGRRYHAARAWDRSPPRRRSTPVPLCTDKCTRIDS